MLNSFLAFHVNAVSNFAYMVTSNLWFLLLIIGVVGTIALNLKEEIDVSVREEQNLIEDSTERRWNYAAGAKTSDL